MERKLERCIRLRFVSLCTCVCVRVCMIMCERSVCFSGNEKNQKNIDQLLKIKDVCLSFNTSLGAFARWKAPSIPRCTTTTTTKREHRRMPRRHDGYCDGRSFPLPRELLLLLFSAFSGCMCFAGLVVI